MPDELITIRGIEECCQFLESIPKQNLPEALLAGLTDGGKVLEESLIFKCPVSGIKLWNPETFSEFTDETGGELRDDIDTVIILDYEFRGGVAKVGFSRKQGWKAIFVEYGHRMIGHKPDKKDLGFVVAHPFMRQAADIAADAAVDAFVQGVMESLSEQGVLQDAA